MNLKLPHLSDSLYSFLPYFHVIAGSVVILTLDHPVASAGGALWIAAGLAVFNKRLTNRIKRIEIGAYGRCEMAHTCERRQALMERRGGPDRRVAEDRRMTERRGAAIDRRTR